MDAWMHGCMKTGAECTCKFYIGKPQTNLPKLVWFKQFSGKRENISRISVLAKGILFPYRPRCTQWTSIQCPGSLMWVPDWSFITMDTSNMIIAKKVMIWGMWCVFLSFFFFFFFRRSAPAPKICNTSKNTKIFPKNTKKGGWPKYEFRQYYIYHLHFGHESKCQE